VFSNKTKQKIEAKKHTTVKATGCIVLQRSDTCTRDSSRDKPGEYRFSINQNRRNWHLIASSEQLASEWIAEIQSVLEKMRAKANAPSPTFPKAPPKKQVPIETFSNTDEEAGVAECGADYSAGSGFC